MFLPFPFDSNTNLKFVCLIHPGTQESCNKREKSDNPICLLEPQELQASTWEAILPGSEWKRTRTSPYAAATCLGTKMRCQVLFPFPALHLAHQQRQREDSLRPTHSTGFQGVLQRHCSEGSGKGEIRHPSSHSHYFTQCS